MPANECTRVVPMYPSQSAMSHLHSLAQSMDIATFLPKHVIPTCFEDYVTSTSGAIRLAFDLLPWPQVRRHMIFLWYTVCMDDVLTYPADTLTNAKRKMPHGECMARPPELLGIQQEEEGQVYRILGWRPLLLGRRSSLYIGIAQQPPRT